MQSPRASDEDPLTLSVSTLPTHKVQRRSLVAADDDKCSPTPPRRFADRLLGVKLVVVTAMFEERVVRSLFDDFAFVDNQDPIGGPDRREAMGDRRSWSDRRVASTDALISRSVSVSTDEVASSMTSSRGRFRIARAIEMSCFCPRLS